MWEVQFQDGLRWETVAAYKFFLTAWMHVRSIEKDAGDIPLQIVRRFA